MTSTMRAHRELAFLAFTPQQRWPTHASDCSWWLAGPRALHRRDREVRERERDSDKVRLGGVGVIHAHIRQRERERHEYPWIPLRPCRMGVRDG